MGFRVSFDAPSPWAPIGKRSRSPNSERQEKEDANAWWKGLLGEAGGVQYNPAIAQ